MYNDKILEFIIHEENHAKISVIGKSNAMLFDCYLQAFEAVYSIVKENNDYKNELDNLQKMGEAAGNTITDMLYYFTNNIIAFSAPRGGGKTSAMLTFSKALKDINNNIKYKDSNDKRLKEKAKQLEDIDFIVLSPIDPTSIDDNHDVLTTILARIIKYASEEWEHCSANSFQYNEEDRLTKKNKLLAMIRKCYQGVNSLQHSFKKPDEWTLENLSLLGDCASLKENFTKAVRYFLELVKPRAKDGYLVIQIDDVDMNFHNVFLMLEMLHNYLLIPGVIIIMATDLDSITRIVFNAFFKEMYVQGSGRDVTKLVSGLAEQYMMKLFPPLRRIYLPNISENLQTIGDIVKISYRNADHITSLDEAADGSNGGNILRFLRKDGRADLLPPLEEALLDFIYLRTGMVFVRHSNYHYILPTNHRGIAQLLSILKKMEPVARLADRCRPDNKKSNELVRDVKEPDNAFFYYSCYEKGDPKSLKEGYLKELGAWARNIQKFRDYFCSVWVASQLSSEDAEIVHELDSIGLSGMNGYIIRKIQERIGKNSDEKKTDKNSDEKKTEENNTSYCHMLKVLSTYERIEPYSRLPFAIHTYYSLFTHKIVLHKMMEFYEDESIEKKTVTHIEAETTYFCDFSMLRKLYGYQLFPYPDTYKIWYGKKEFPVALQWENNADPRHFIKLVDTSPKNRLALRWALLMNHNSYNNTGIPNGKKTLDITAPMLNVLFINHTISQAKGIYADLSVDAVDDVNDGNVCFLEQLKMLQDSSLRVVMNWDLQHRLKKRISYSFRLDNVDSEDVRIKLLNIDILHNVYKEFERILKKADSVNKTWDEDVDDFKKMGLVPKEDDADDFAFLQEKLKDTGLTNDNNNDKNKANPDIQEIDPKADDRAELLDAGTLQLKYCDCLTAWIKEQGKKNVDKNNPIYDDDDVWNKLDLIPSGTLLSGMSKRCSSCKVPNDLSDNIKAFCECVNEYKEAISAELPNKKKIEEKYNALMNKDKLDTLKMYLGNPYFDTNEFVLIFDAIYNDHLSVLGDMQPEPAIGDKKKLAIKKNELQMDNIRYLEAYLDRLKAKLKEIIEKER